MTTSISYKKKKNLRSRQCLYVTHSATIWGPTTRKGWLGKWSLGGYFKMICDVGKKAMCLKKWSRRSGLNGRPADYELHVEAILLF